MPDGCLDLQWFNGVLRVAGPDREAKVEVLPGGTTVIGLRFQAGSAVPWLGVPASEIINERVPLEAFWEREARDLTEWANEARTVDGIARRLEAALARRAATVRPPNAIARSMFRLVGASRQPGNWVIRNLRDRLELSERTLRRHCHEAFGYGPKTLDRILRFQRFLRLAQSSRPGRAGRLGRGRWLFGSGASEPGDAKVGRRHAECDRHAAHWLTGRFVQDGRHNATARWAQSVVDGRPLASNRGGLHETAD